MADIEKKNEENPVDNKTEDNKTEDNPANGEEGDGKGDSEVVKNDDCKSSPKTKCPTEDQGKSLQSGNNEIDNIKAKISQQVSGTIDALFKNPQECVANYSASAPNMITGMIEGVGNSVAGSFDKIADAFGNMTSAAANAEFVNPIEYAKNLVKIKFQGIFNNIILGENWEEIMKTEKNPNKLAELIMLRSDLLNGAFNSLKFQKKFKPWLDSYMDSLTKSLKMAKPKIDEIKHEIDETIEGFGSNIGTTIGNSVANAILTATSVIPGVGTTISAINAAGKLGENLIKMCEKPISTVGGIYVKTSDAIKKEADRLDCETKKVLNFLPKAGGNGGRRSMGQHKISIKQIKKRINKATKRVNYLLTRFKNKRKKVNYTRRLLNRR